MFSLRNLERSYNWIDAMNHGIELFGGGVCWMYSSFFRKVSYMSFYDGCHVQRQHKGEISMINI